MADILVVDDDQAIANAFTRLLTHDRHEFRVASGAEEALRLLEDRVPDLVFMDVRMPGLDGLQALPMMRRQFPAAEVVIMTAYGSSQTSIDAMRAGAFDLLHKPLDVVELRSIIDRVAAAQAVRTKLASRAPADAVELSALVGSSDAMQTVFKMIGRLAALDVAALVVGERGTGKHVTVQAIHSNGARQHLPLTIVDARVALPAQLNAVFLGRHPGTVHLSHVDELSAHDQARLLPFIREQGSTTRIIASAEIDLRVAVEHQEFDRSLAEMLGAIIVSLPPLRERREDISGLVDVLLARVSTQLKRDIRGVDDRVARMFREHSWPGNVAELLNVLRHAAIVAATDVITVDDLGDSLSANRASLRRSGDSALGKAARESLRDRLASAAAGASAFHDVVAVVEEALVQEALDITSGNQVKAAELLGVNRTTLRKKASSGD